MLEVTKGHPFEHEWEIDYDIFGEDKIDSTIPFSIKNLNGDTVLNLQFNYGMTVLKFDSEKSTKLVISLYETDIFEDGEYEFSYNCKTLNGKQVVDLAGKIIVSSSKSDTVPSLKREVRPWDLLKSKKPGSAGERASDEKQQERMSICQECPRFVKLTSQCLECGCIMNLKTKLEQATCPLGKW